MSVALYKFNRDRSKIVLSVNISTQRFYVKYWIPAISEIGVKYICDGSRFGKSNLDDVLKELDLLHIWALENMNGYDQEYMITRIKDLQRMIPKALEDVDAILHIF
ncbi:MAG: hypothetical protein FWG14_02715 [Peptococcaceae bacterium]|nr:hypothetical protein [Peptococcaceae bacterium]